MTKEHTKSFTSLFTKLQWYKVMHGYSYCINCTGFLSINEWRSNSCVWCTSHYPVMHRCTRQTTFTCCLKVTFASFVPQAPEHVLFQEHTIATVTGVLLQLDRVCGTACDSRFLCAIGILLHTYFHLVLPPLLQLLLLLQLLPQLLL